MRKRSLRQARLALPARRLVLRQAGAFVVGSMLGCGGTGPINTEPARASQRSRIETDVVATLERCYAIAPETRALVDEAVAVLAFPTVATTSPGGDEQAGNGALRIGNVFTRYYVLTARWQGRQHDARARSFIFLFSSWDALTPWRTSQALDRIDADIAMPRLLPDGRIDTAASPPPVLLLLLDGPKLAVRPVPAAYTIMQLDV